MKHYFLYLLLLLIITSCQTSPTPSSLQPYNSSPPTPLLSPELLQSLTPTIPITTDTLPIYISQPAPDIYWGDIVSTIPEVEQRFWLINDTEDIYMMQRIMTGDGGCYPNNLSGRDHVPRIPILPGDTLGFMLNQLTNGRRFRITKYIRIYLRKLPLDTTDTARPLVKRFKFHGYIFPVAAPDTLYFPKVMRLGERDTITTITLR